jgi:hypothetical protein
MPDTFTLPDGTVLTFRMLDTGEAEALLPDGTRYEIPTTCRWFSTTIPNYWRAALYRFRDDYHSRQVADKMRQDVT